MDHERCGSRRSVATHVLLTRRTLLMAAALAPLAAEAQAQTAWPSRPITYVVPYPAGGTTDLLGRLVSQALSETLGVPVVVDNRSGAVGTIGGAFVARAAPTGDVLLGTSIGPQTIMPHLMKLSYDPAKAYEPIVTIGTVPHVLVVAENSPFNSVQDLIAAAKAKPSSISFASGGLGSIIQMQGEFLALQTDTTMVHVPYRGDAPAIQDVMSGQVNFVFTPVSVGVPQVQAGKVKALAVTSAQRLPALPNVPTMTELGFKDFVIEQWQAVYAPAGTPADRVQRLNRDIDQYLHKPETVAHLEKAGVTVVGGTPDELAKRQATDFERWGRIIKAANIKME